ncbi:MAG: hypothetical protein ACRYF0_07705 [Janthinobacterium lividum]
MPQLLPEDFADKWIPLLADNVFMNIDGPLLERLIVDIKDSFAASLATANVPDWLKDTYYPLGYVILHSFAGGKAFFMKAKLAGYLPVPTKAEGDDNWEPALSPAADNALYQVGTVAALRREQGNWVPSRLYVLMGRVDATSGDELPDVYVRAVTTEQLEPTGYSLDLHAIPQLPVAVRYDLDQDQTEPTKSASSFADLLGAPADNTALGAVLASLASATSAQKQRIDALLAGANGAVDTFIEAYNRFVADESAAAALTGQVSSLQAVQRQHSTQLATLGAQGAPAMCYLSDGSTVGFASVDEALADKRQKVFMRFNVATLTVTASNMPRGSTASGWPNYLDASGSTIFIADGVTLSVPGDSVDALLLANFFFYLPASAAGTGVVSLLAARTSGSGPGQYPQLLNGYSQVPLRLNYGTFTVVNGYYASFTGTGTVHLYGNVQVDQIASGITVVDHRSSGSGPGGASSFAALTGEPTDNAKLKAALATTGSSSARPSQHQTFASQRLTAIQFHDTVPAALSLVAISNLAQLATQVNYQDAGNPGVWLTLPAHVATSDAASLATMCQSLLDDMAAIPAASLAIAAELQLLSYPLDSAQEANFFVSGLGGGQYAGRNGFFRTTYTGPPQGNLVLNSQFTDASAWTTYGGSITIGGGQAAYASQGGIYQRINLQSDRYEIRVRVLNLDSGGSVQLLAEVPAGAASGSRSFYGPGDYTFQFDWSGGEIQLRAIGTSSAVLGHLYLLPA